MTPGLHAVTLVVKDYDEALDWFTRVLGFETLEDTDLGGGKRWILVAPRGSGGARLLLARAVTPEQLSRVGDQTGGRVFLFLDTDDFARDHAALRAAGVRLHGEPRDEPYGRVVVFEDLYGNRWDLVERATGAAAPPRADGDAAPSPAQPGSKR